MTVAALSSLRQTSKKSEAHGSSRVTGGEILEADEAITRHLYVDDLSNKDWEALFCSDYRMEQVNSKEGCERIVQDWLI